jgi:hypothetical protein
VNVEKVLDLISTVQKAKLRAAKHCYKGYCVLHDCLCTCAGCSPEDAVLAAKVALADAVISDPPTLADADDGADDGA